MPRETIASSAVNGETAADVKKAQVPCYDHIPETHLETHLEQQKQQ